MDFSEWAIQLPDNNNFYTQSSTNPLVSKKDYKDFVRWDADGCPTFKAPNKGQTTSGSVYVRAELREALDGNGGLHDFGRNWVTSTASSSNQDQAARVDGVLRATLSIEHVSTTGGSKHKIGRLVVAQIRSKDDEVIRLYYRKLPDHTHGSVWFATVDPLTGQTAYHMLFGFKSSSGSDPSEGIPLGVQWGYVIDLHGDEMTVSVTNHLGRTFVKQITVSQGYRKEWLYFKAGVYNGNNEGDSTDYVEAKYYSLTHGARGPTPPSPPVPDTPRPSTPVPPQPTRAPQTLAPRTPSPVTRPPVTTGPQPPSSCTGKTLPLWSNCKNSPACCEAGTQCYVQSQWYAQCRRSPVSPQPTRAPQPPATPSPATRPPVTTGPQPPSTSCTGKTVSLWSNCKNSPACCVAGAQCYEKNQWYAQCRTSCDRAGWSCRVL